MSFGGQIVNEYKKIEKARDQLIKSAVVNLRSDLIEASPVDTGELRTSWEQPKRVSKGKWIVTNVSPHATVINDGLRVIPVRGKEKQVGSAQLPYGFTPIIEVTEKALIKRFKKL